ncbi:hypothetical protein ES703_98338 [subsurface metagenome]
MVPHQENNLFGILIRHPESPADMIRKFCRNLLMPIKVNLVLLMCHYPWFSQIVQKCRPFQILIPGTIVNNIFRMLPDILVVVFFRLFHTHGGNDFRQDKIDETRLS